MDDIVVICTKDRSEELLRLIDSIEDNIKIVIVDSSLKKNILTNKNIVYIHKPKSNLIIAREIAVKYILQNYETDNYVIHFLDDDCVVQKNYFKNINETFKSFEAIGVTGFNIIYNEWKTVIKPLIKYIKYFRKNQGRFVIFGFALGCYENIGVKQVHWLPGFSMSIKAKYLSTLKFDKYLSKFNCIGEDIDLSFQLNKYGKLYFNSNAQLKHFPSKINRTRNILKKYYRQINSSMYIYKKYYSELKVLKNDINDSIS